MSVVDKLLNRLKCAVLQEIESGLKYRTQSRSPYFVVGRCKKIKEPMAQYLAVRTTTSINIA